MKIKNIEKVAERIKEAVQKKERIILYGDSDMDGISSSVLLEEAINKIGGRVDFVYFPNREQDGYGVNKRAIEDLRDKSPALFITLDLGIGNIKEVEELNQLGFQVIIVDHHQPKERLPDASIIVNPFQEGDNYPFKQFANAGIIFYLALELLGDKVTEEDKNSLAELATLGTIADMVPQIEDNKKIIERGLKSLNNTRRPGFKAFFDIFSKNNILDNKVAHIISALNSAESEEGKNKAYDLLTSNSDKDCSVIAQELIDKNSYKQEQIKNITEEVERRIMQQPDYPIIFEGDPSWRLIWAGSVASIIENRYKKPVFIFKKMDKESVGSIRSPKGTNSVEAMHSCEDLLLTYGGHPVASGFRIKNDNLELFKNHLIEYFK